MSGEPWSPAAPTWRAAWTDALYGPHGFFREHSPGEHFRTSVHASGLFTDAILRLVREHELRTVVDMGAGRGELLQQMHERCGPGELRLVAVEVADRPHALAPEIEWSPVLPDHIDGLLIANEWLDNVPCDVVEVDADGVPRTVHVDPETCDEQLGGRAVYDWLSRWWHLDVPGQRAELGSSRDDAWVAAVDRLRSGIALAIDYGHVAHDRPRLGSVRSYLRGREVDVRLDGTRDVTAHVAVDALAHRVGARLVRQRDALAGLGVSGVRPSLDLATGDPRAYVAALSQASESAELTAPAGLGDFWWVVAER